MSEETLETAARRIIRFVRVDENSGGGLLSIETLKALATLDYELARRLAEQKAAEQQADDGA